MSAQRNPQPMNIAQQSLYGAPLSIVAAGMCCAVGYNLAAASCALRANMDHFEESEFVDQAGEPVKVARLPLGDLWGAKRLAYMVGAAAMDCAIAAGSIHAPTTALLLLSAERGRPHTEDNRYHEAYRACEEQLNAKFHESSQIVSLGRAGISRAILFAHGLLQQKTVARVLLVGADSFLNAATIGYYLSQDRLLCTGNSNGFIPGEGAGAILLELANANSIGLCITGIGHAIEAAKPDGELPNRSIGLTQAIRQACDQAGIAPNQLEFRMSDQNGEQYFAKEAANAYTRIMADDGVGLPLLHIADCVGETGAAAGPLALAYLTSLMARQDGPGEVGLLHFANDDGTRSGVIVEYRT